MGIQAVWTQTWNFIFCGLLSRHTLSVVASQRIPSELNTWSVWTNRLFTCERLLAPSNSECVFNKLCSIKIFCWRILFSLFRTLCCAHLSSIGLKKNPTNIYLKTSRRLLELTSCVETALQWTNIFITSYSVGSTADRCEHLQQKTNFHLNSPECPIKYATDFSRNTTVPRCKCWSWRQHKPQFLSFTLQECHIKIV